MSGINFLSDNLVDNGTFTITTGSENAQFPISNLQNDSTTIKFRSAGNTIVFYIDLGANRDIDTVALVGDATGDLGVTSVDIRTSLTTVFAGGYTSVTLSSEHNIGYVFISEVSHRYIEFTLTGTGSYAELSNIFVGKRLNLPQNSLSIASFTYGNEDRSVISENEYGQKFIDIRNQTKMLGGNIQYCTKDEFEVLDDMFIYHGVIKPLWLILDPDDSAMNDSSTRLSLYGYLEKIPNWKADGGQLYSAKLDLMQVV